MYAPTDKLVVHFQESLKKDYGADVNADDARKSLECWTNFFDVLAQIDFQTKQVPKKGKLES